MSEPQLQRKVERTFQRKGRDGSTACTSRGATSTGPVGIDRMDSEYLTKELY